MIATVMKIKVSFSPVKIGNDANPCLSWQSPLHVLVWSLSLLRGRTGEERQSQFATGLPWMEIPNLPSLTTGNLGPLTQLRDISRTPAVNKATAASWDYQGEEMY